MAIQEDPNVPPASPGAGAAAAPGAGVAEARRVPTSHGIEWLSAGWRIFRPQAGMWILLGLVFLLISVAIGAIPLLGQIAAPVLMPVFIAGMMVGCDKVRRGEELELADLFVGFRRNTGPLVVVGVIAFVLMIVVLISVMVVTGAGAMLAIVSGNHAAAMAAPNALPGLLLLALAIPVNMAMWFAPALIVFHREPPARSMILSFQACLRNIVPFLVYGVVVFVLAMVASLPLLLGWLALGPVLVGSVYGAYRDVFQPR